MEEPQVTAVHRRSLSRAELADRLRVNLGINHLSEFERDYLTERNAASGIWLAIVTIGLETWMIKNSLEMAQIPAVVEKVGWPWIMQHRAAYITMLVSAVVFVGFEALHRLRGVGGRTLRNLSISQFYAVTLLAGVYFALADFTRGNGMGSFLTEAVALTCVFCVRPCLVLAALGGSFWWLIVRANELGQMSHAAMINNSFLLIFLMIGGVSRYAAAVGAARANWQMRELSLHDNLTGASNMRGLRLDFPNLVGTPVCVAMVDLDDFKGLNDTLGHDAGDQLLAAFGAALHQAAEGLGAQCYRYGGDEFLLVGPVVDDKRMQRAHADLLARLAEVDEASLGLPEADIHHPLLSCSMGYCVGVPDDSEQLRAMIRQADTHMYESKRRDGKGHCSGGAFEA